MNDDERNVIADRWAMVMDMADALASSLVEEGVEEGAARRVSRLAILGQLTMGMIQTFPDDEVTAEDINEHFSEEKVNNMLNTVLNG
jgi:hypothetical protein